MAGIDKELYMWVISLGAILATLWYLKVPIFTAIEASVVSVIIIIVVSKIFGLFK